MNSLLERRRLLLGLVPLLLLAACQSAPPAAEPEAPTREQKVAALQQLGFVPADSAWELNLGVKLLFATDVDELSPQGREAVGNVALALARVGIERMLVEGHTDNVGSARYNEQLSLRRAETVAQQLVAVGLKDSAIERRGLGFAKPVADNATPEGRAQNRRVVVTVRVD
jgi:outer membrane protein OmpA-like peptidoglycan-associated protein